LIVEGDGGVASRLLQARTTQNSSHNASQVDPPPPSPRHPRACFPLQGMDDWDQETLERVVKEKHGAEKPSNATSIICKFFLDAVEKRQYGWFWKCPNGADCKYR